MQSQDKGRRKPLISDTARSLLARLRTGQTARRGEAGLDELLPLGLAAWNGSAGAYIATDVKHSERAYVQRMHRESRAALRSAEAMQALNEELRSLCHADGQSGVRVIRHVSDVTVEIGVATSAATTSMMTAHPMVRSAETLERAIAMDRLLIERGLTFKTIYLDNARTRQPEQDYASVMLGLGAEIRTALPPFERMIIVDERVAFLADPHGDPVSKPAIMVTHPSLVAFAVNVFQQQWDRAEPWELDGPAPITTLRTRRILRRLSKAVPIKSIAAELELSPATVYADLKALREIVGVETEWQLAMWWATSEEARKEREKDR